MTVLVPEEGNKLAIGTRLENKGSQIILLTSGRSCIAGCSLITVIVKTIIKDLLGRGILKCEHAHQ